MRLRAANGAYVTFARTLETPKNTREARRGVVLALILPMVARGHAHVPLGVVSLIFST